LIKRNRVNSNNDEKEKQINQTLPKQVNYMF